MIFPLLGRPISLSQQKTKNPDFYVGILVISVSFAFIRWQSYEVFVNQTNFFGIFSPHPLMSNVKTPILLHSPTPELLYFRTPNTGTHGSSSQSLEPLVQHEADIQVP